MRIKMSILKLNSGLSFSSISCVFRVYAFLSLLVLVSTGCSAFRPTLRVAYNDPVPLPKNIIETQIWEKAKPLRVKLAQSGGQTTTAEIRGMHDGRAISFLIAWPDQSASVLSKAWVRPTPSAPWRLEEVINDRLWVIFPLTPRAPLDIFSGPNSQYDAWQWQGGAWSNESGYADDGRLIVKYHPGAEPPKEHDGTIYPSPTGRGFIEQTWRDDDGNLGTIARSQPLPYEPKTVSPAPISNPIASGSAIDVRVLGAYSRQETNTTTTFWTKRGGRVPGYWFGDNPPVDGAGSYFVRYYRLLNTTAREEDYQFNGPGPHPFALAIVDDKSGAQPFVSAPLRLILDKVPK